MQIRHIRNNVMKSIEEIMWMKMEQVKVYLRQAEELYREIQCEIYKICSFNFPGKLDKMASSGIAERVSGVNPHILSIYEVYIAPLQGNYSVALPAIGLGKKKLFM